LTGAETRPGARKNAAPRHRPSTIGLRRLLDELGAAKHRLLAETSALRVIDRRVCDWDMGEPFQARRGRALRSTAALRFADELTRLELLLARLAREDLAAVLRARPRSPGTRRLLVGIYTELRYLQRAFDGGSLLLAHALATVQMAD
jgi:hypothetical protein